MQNMRSYHGLNQRAISTSADEGYTWSPVTMDTTLIEPVCQASLIRYSASHTGQPEGVLLFSNPASTERERMTIRASFDDGATWPDSLEIETGSSAYSSLVALPANRIGLLYERNDYKEIVFWQGPSFW